MLTRKYNLVNNVIGWVVFAIALVTYWLTLEPTASYWDCGEFIIQADKLEVGHPPGNPIFMLTARFFEWEEVEPLCCLRLNLFFHGALAVWWVSERTRPEAEKTRITLSSTRFEMRCCFFRNCGQLVPLG